jgi:hypothetical protein
METTVQELAPLRWVLLPLFYLLLDFSLYLCEGGRFSPLPTATAAAAGAALLLPVTSCACILLLHLTLSNFILQLAFHIV